ncbi:hypothetical protein AGMMS49574_12810 [Bacteroidia bacterium]|nr:hypothetical protein AGMMS49574_12810 [Bacteroidia bacterium]
MKRVLGLDLGTNSIGWALIDTDEEGNPISIKKAGSRIIPMSQDILGNFDRGNSISQTAERTSYRGVRRLRERHLLRRERLHRVLHLIGFLPPHYEEEIGWDREDNKTFAKFLTDTEPKLPWKKNVDGKYDFFFKSSYGEMLADFKENQPQLFKPKKNGTESLIPYDWTIYYLRKKALSKPISREELAWVLLNFNQKRGYYQLRGEDEDENSNKEYHALTVRQVTADEPQKGKTDIWYNVELENGWIYRRSSKTPLFDWEGKVKEFIVTTELDSDGAFKIDKDGIVKRTFRAPSEDDWMLVKKKTESDIEKSDKTVGCYIYETLLKKPNQKVRGQLIRAIERRFYKNELIAILNKQKEFHPELQDNEIYARCVNELYPNNEAHSNNLMSTDFTYLFVNDIIFYQRPLKSKKSLINNCPFEYHTFIKEGEKQIIPLKCISKSNPLFQEFRLWQFVQNLKIYEREKEVGGKVQIDVDVTADFLPSMDSYAILFEWLNERKTIKQDELLKAYFKKVKRRGADKYPYRWNYVEDKEYPCNETHAQILSRLKRAGIPEVLLSKELEMKLWHILYSIEAKDELIKALNCFKNKYELTDSFVDEFKNMPPFKKEYGSYSEKAIKKLLPLMRMGKYWSVESFHSSTLVRIDKLLNKDYDETIRERVREKSLNLTDIYHLEGIPLWLASYIVYDRHSESSAITKWKKPEDIELFLNEFKQHSLRNPIVEQVVMETLRVVRDIWSAYGDISEIHIELGREMKNDKKERERITKQISENEDTNLRIKSLLIELQNDPNIENVRPYSPSQQEILRIYEEGALLSYPDLPTDILKISKTNQPTKSELIRYKLWLEQKYCSPYTGETIPLSKLFTSSYEIEHVIPQSRYFDNSLSNKIICEYEVNKLKSNLLGYEFIKRYGGEMVSLGFGKSTPIFTASEYEEFVKKHYWNNRSKMKKMLLEDIPNSFIERQLNDTRYISKLIKALLSNIVRQEDDQEAISKNVIPCTGGITSELKKDWGLGDVWNKIIQPRFERLNQLSDSTNFGEWRNNHFQIQMPIEFQKGFNKKRIDHRHHALDAIIIACATRSHINFLNNESAAIDKKDIRFDLRNRLCSKIKMDDQGNYQWQFNKPWGRFTEDVLTSLEKLQVSFKQNIRVINKTTNKYQAYVNGVRKTVTQKKGDSWAIRKPLHKETVFAKVSLRKIKEGVRFSNALNNWKDIVDKDLKNEIQRLILLYGKFETAVIIKYFKDRDYRFNEKNVSKVDVYVFEEDNSATRKNLSPFFDKKTIESITDTGIQKILLKHLEVKGNNTEIAFSLEGIEEMNQRMVELNNGKSHQPIYKVRVSEPLGNKFAVGSIGNKKDKYVEAAKGTNLFYGVYQSEEKKRVFETIPLSVVIERQKQGLSSVPDTKMDKDKLYKLLFFLSPNDLVYIPTEEERENPHLFDCHDLSKEQIFRIYKMVSFSGSQSFFILSSVANPIINKKEFSLLNKMERAISGEMIKDICWKLIVDRLGNIIKCIK